jgi:hypothetical protein
MTLVESQHIFVENIDNRELPSVEWLRKLFEDYGKITEFHYRYFNEICRVIDVTVSTDVLGSHSVK